MQKRVNFILASLFATSVIAQIEMTQMSTCVQCFQNISTNFVCKDNFLETRSYCCSNAQKTNRQCNRDVCSTTANTTSMKFYSCPYEPKMCGSTVSKLAAEIGKIYTVQTSSLFVLNNVCYWTIQSNYTAKGVNSPKSTFIEIRGNKIQGVSLYVNNGRSPTTAGNQTTIGTFSSTILSYNAN